MTSGKITLIFVLFNCLMFSTLVFPPFFKLFNKIEPWIFGLPFVQFWIIFVITVISLSFIVWYKIEEARGELE
ncbi:hypothetical protein CVD25_09415 [Bacillus canaveralius]|uniref:DUF3311 domain-containing protein n=1 Tax=Bacillus canaveralius TaxID=1403243 RepID=A0A2N5GKT7_9BACI|nr:hypothetical protein CVD23_18745 [Bacillus sp. V33-4]PLR82068.1 hypothetical protein CU635_12925 [Bacillus canaveralius]PLR98026.1 hypothetical protein CVD25_09415 [Bacillus canaveralius]